MEAAGLGRSIDVQTIAEIASTVMLGASQRDAAPNAVADFRQPPQGFLSRGKRDVSSSRSAPERAFSTTTWNPPTHVTSGATVAVLPSSHAGAIVAPFEPGRAEPASSPARLRVERLPARERDEEHRRPARGAVDPERAAEHPHALVDADQPEAPALGGRRDAVLDAEAAAVVGDA